VFPTPISSGASSGSNLVPLSPNRVLDTRAGDKIGEIDGSGTALTVRFAGKGGVPSSGATAVSLNVTVVDGEAGDFGGFVTVFPCGKRPDSSSLNFTNGQTIPNSVTAVLSASGDVCFYVYGKAHLLADVNGYYTTAERGPKGAKGDRGPEGPEGPEGPAGPAGGPTFYLIESGDEYMASGGFTSGTLTCPLGTVAVAGNVYSPGLITNIKLYDWSAFYFLSNDLFSTNISGAYAQLTCADQADSLASSSRSKDSERPDFEEWVGQMVSEFEALHESK